MDRATRIAKIEKLLQAAHKAAEQALDLATELEGQLTEDEISLAGDLGAFSILLDGELDNYEDWHIRTESYLAD